MIELSNELKEELVKIGEDTYAICELTYLARSKYLRSVGKTMEVKFVGSGELDEKGEEKVAREVIVKDMAGATGELLCGTMFRVGEDGSHIPVTMTQVSNWGANLVEELSKIATRLNGLEKSDSTLKLEAEKN